MRKQNVAYLRVSTEAQTEKYGLDMQRQKILEYCDREGISIDKWYVDGGYSGSKLDRPKIQEMLADVKKGEIGKIFVYKLDRMSRDTIDTLNLINKMLPEHGVKLISMTEEIRTENPMDKVMVTMNAAMNQYEREVIRMRMSAGMKERIKRGLWMGGGRVPWGYYYDRNDGILHPHPEQAEMVRKAYELYIDGLSCEKIAKILGFKGENVVMNILKRKSNIGMIEYKGEEYKGMHEPIVSKELFYRAQECMKRRCTNSHISNYHILTGLCRCGRCGARMRYQKWGRKGHKIVCYSQYKGGKEYMIRDPNCDNPRADAFWIEGVVTECFQNFVLNVEKKGKTESRKASIQKTNQKIKRLYSLYAENGSDNLLEVVQEEEERLKGLKKELREEESREAKSASVDLKEIRRVSHVWDMLSDREKNRVLKDCIDRIVIDGEDVDIHFKL